MLEENHLEELTHTVYTVYTVAWLNCCPVNYLAGWIGVMILALYLCIKETILEYSLRVYSLAPHTVITSSHEYEYTATQHTRTQTTRRDAEASILIFSYISCHSHISHTLILVLVH